MARNASLQRAPRITASVMVTALILSACSTGYGSGPVSVGSEGATSASVSTIPASSSQTDPSAKNTSSSPTLSPVAADGQLSAPVSYTEAGITLTPPPPNAEAVSETTAATGLQAALGPQNLNTSNWKLAVLTDDMTATQSPDGTSTPKFVNQLVWAYISTTPYTDPCDYLIGPKTASGQPACENAPTPAAGTMITSVWFVDATTGQYLEGATF